MNELFETRRELVLSRVKEIILKGNRLLCMELPHVEIKFDLRGTNAGQASIKDDDLSMRFNRDMMMNEGWDHLYSETIPHEIAHIFFMAERKNVGHNKEWKRLCVALGGSGERCHNERVVYARGKTYEYVALCGTKVQVSQIRHKKIQRGFSYTWSAGMVVKKECQFVEIS